MRRRHKRHTCSREGCPGTYSQQMHDGGLRYCSMICSRIDADLDELIDALRDSSDPGAEVTLTEAWTTLVQAADLFSDYRRLREENRRTNSRRYPGRRTTPQPLTRPLADAAGVQG
ncbi:hypothetical protein [Rhodococcus aetherivorans]|uniref:hypothetical protein n=1 Tax=Rhodococcus aetherivorans TaxID=191292 RepID=UPI00241FFE66|nr:hypothetical protein [Rhodococcus aetherivorans]WFS15177.1 hypothetical protein P9K37_09095 [Rhodococcus aetherivorans]